MTATSPLIPSGFRLPHAVAGRSREAQRTIIFPTLRNLEKLATWHSPEEAISETLNSTVVPVLPWTEKREDGNYLCIPTEAGYAISEEKMPERKAK